jgi:hypothetical protein
MVTVTIDAIAHSYAYPEYRNRIANLLLEGKTSGNIQSEALVHYSQLNATRMNRLDKTITIAEEYTAQLQSLQGNYIWLVLAEGWCGDAAQIVPVINKMAMLSDRIELKILFRDENEELMNRFLTNGTKGIPKLIVLDKTTLEVLGDFGPRPKGAAQFMVDYKTTHGLIDETAKAELQLWYFHNKGIEIQQEITDLMQSIEANLLQKALV